MLVVSSSHVVYLIFFIIITTPFNSAFHHAYHGGRIVKQPPLHSLNKNQLDFMANECCILVNENDHIIGECSKSEAHTFSITNPRALLHRAFSLFLFNTEGKLLIQQRALDKITFPGVWSNTCCSHPLFRQIPDEVDDDLAVSSGNVIGVKNAIQRKLLQELGVTLNKAQTDRIKYLTRVHYWAADKVTHGEQSPWGEHEVDYILFCQLDSIECNPNAEEVKDFKYVTLSELKEMMLPSSGLLWSPWFRIIVEKFLVHWWEDLNTTLTTEKFVDYTTIYRFDPREEHQGGAGGAGKWLGTAKYLD